VAEPTETKQQVAWAAFAKKLSPRARAALMAGSTDLVKADDEAEEYAAWRARLSEGAREKLDESVPQVEKPELDANPNTYQFTLIEHFDGEYPVVRTFKSAELMALHIARLEGQNVTVTAFYGVVMRLTKGPTRYLTMPDRETALTVPHGGFGPSKRVELDLLGCLDVQEDGFLGDPELCEPATVVEKCEKQIRDVASRQAAGDEDDEDQDEDDEPPEDDDE